MFAWSVADRGKLQIPHSPDAEEKQRTSEKVKEHRSTHFNAILTETETLFGSMCQTQRKMKNAKQPTG